MKYKDLFFTLVEEINIIRVNLEQIGRVIDKSGKKLYPGDIEEILDKLNPNLGWVYSRVFSLYDWLDERFDVFEKMPEKNKQQKIWENYHSMLCSECERHNIEWYMVKDEIWNKLSNDDHFLCFSCLEKRMGRKLNLDDFTNAPINDEHIERMKNEKT